MISNDFFGIHLDIHWAHDRAGSIRFASGLGALDGKYPKQICDSQHGAVRTGVLTPRSLYEDREKQCQAQNGERGPGYFRAPEIEQGKIGIIGFEDQRSTVGSHVQHPDQHAISQVPKNTVEACWNKMVVTPFEEFPAYSSNPFLDCAQRADPSAKDWSKQNGQKQHNPGKNER